MGSGLSSLQRQILDVLASFPSYEEVARSHTVSGWARPGDILAALRGPPTPSNRSSLSKALKRLYERGLIARASGELAMRGKAFCYVRITDDKNAGAGNDGPVAILQSAKRKMRSI
jgi:hypothetical protein